MPLVALHPLARRFYEKQAVVIAPLLFDDQTASDGLAHRPAPAGHLLHDFTRHRLRDPTGIGLESRSEHLGQNHQIGIRFGNHSPGRPQIGRRIFPHHVELTQSHFQFHIVVRFFTKIKFPATRFFSFDYPKYLSRRRATAIANVTQAAVKFLNVPPYVLE